MAKSYINKELTEILILCKHSNHNQCLNTIYSVVCAMKDDIWLFFCMECYITKDSIHSKFSLTICGSW